ncbi:MAG: sulfatase-like hydrolase/transferase [Alphaproteobacteria bacterium]|nr:sulfatase-like hydrolase/transferase [Alphaproteobacteria bacterium]
MGKGVLNLVAPRALGAVAAGLALLGSARADPPPANHRPNVVLILVDDAAFMDFGAYGGEAHTPNIDRLAGQGVLFTDYHTSPLCSPSRAMLLTGVDNHRTGVSTIEEVIPPEQRGKPGYTLHFEPGVVTIASRLKAAGYRTYMAGKWHLGHGPGDLPDAHGFDHSLALDASGADNWQQKPYMPYYDSAPWFEDGKPTRLPDDFYSSTLLVDRMIGYLQAGKDSGQPFFAYLPFQAVHIPVQAPKEYSDHYAGRFDAGWDVLRRDRWERAQKLGLIPESAPLGPMPKGSRPWSSLSPEDQKIYARSMEVYAGMMEAMDHEIGRLIGYLEAQGQFADTVFIIASDNGPEPSDPVHAQGMDLWMGLHGYDWKLDDLGLKGSLNYIGPEWAGAAASPGILFKFYTAEGGVHAPLIVSGPGIAAGARTAAQAFVTDVAPTILDLTGVPDTHAPGGIPMWGRSLAPVLDGQANTVHGPDDPVGFEVSGNASLFRGDYKLVRDMPPYGDGQWRLFNLAADPGETSDLAASRPDLFTEMKRDYAAYAKKAGVLELPEGYDVQQQIVKNAIGKQVRRYGGGLAAAGAAIVLVLAAGLWLVLRRRGKRSTS